jgi:hypothetical protein
MPKMKRPNAQKHGAFAATTILPGENPREFEELLSDLVEEWTPDGPTEEDAVLSLAKCIWRKRRVQRFLETELMKNILDPGHASYDESLGLLGFAAIMATTPEVAFDSYAHRCLREERIKYLRKKFPWRDFKSTSKWAQAIINEINSVLLPALTIDLRELNDRVLLQRSSATLSQDLFKHELALDERLDAMIDRAIKRLVHTKMMKQMMSQTSTEQADDQLTRVQNSKPNRLGKIVN